MADAYLVSGPPAAPMVVVHTAIRRVEVPRVVGGHHVPGRFQHAVAHGQPRQERLEKCWSAAGTCGPHAPGAHARRGERATPPRTPRGAPATGRVLGPPETVAGVTGVRSVPAPFCTSSRRRSIICSRPVGPSRAFSNASAEVTVVCDGRSPSGRRRPAHEGVQLARAARDDFWREQLVDGLRQVGPVPRGVGVVAEQHSESGASGWRLAGAARRLMRRSRACPVGQAGRPRGPETRPEASEGSRRARHVRRARPCRTPGPSRKPCCCPTESSAAAPSGPGPHTGSSCAASRRRCPSSRWRC